VEAVSITAASARDPFYNSRLQMVNQGADKLILLAHPGGDLTLRLRQRIPWTWLPADILLDGLDHTLIFAQQTGGDYISLGFSLFPCLWVGWQAFKRRLTWRRVRLALLYGAGLALLQGGYALARLEEVTITSKTVTFSAWSVAAAFLLAFCGALGYFQARTRRGRLAALLVVTFPAWFAGLFGMLAVGSFNYLAFAPRYGVGLHNYALGLLPLGAFWLECALAGPALWGISGAA
jgi:hypothetical protein